MTSVPRPGTLEKALKINLSKQIYGTFAEIGAGQEIANWFFRAGGASGTVAKTMSAYDMTISDEIYGKCSRYVSRQRMCDMLEHEYPMLIQRLNTKRGATTTFFDQADVYIETLARDGSGVTPLLVQAVGDRIELDALPVDSPLRASLRRDAEHLAEALECIGAAAVVFSQGATAFT